jgi:hypothetical protein
MTVPWRGKSLASSNFRDLTIVPSLNQAVLCLAASAIQSPFYWRPAQHLNLSLLWAIFLNLSKPHQLQQPQLPLVLQVLRVTHESKTSSDCTTRIAFGDWTQTFLASGVPNLEFHLHLLLRPSKSGTQLHLSIEPRRQTFSWTIEVFPKWQRCTNWEGGKRSFQKRMIGGYTWTRFFWQDLFFWINISDWSHLYLIKLNSKPFLSNYNIQIFDNSWPMICLEYQCILKC